jgi:ribosomal protein S4
MKNFFSRLDTWLQKIFVVELPENIRRNISKKELIDLYLFCEKDEEKFRVQLVMLLEKRLPGRMTEMEINSCFNWVREAVKK